MIKRFALTAVVLATVASAYCDDAASLKKTALPVYQKIASLTNQRNFSGLKQVFVGATTSDFKNIGLKGNAMSRDEVLGSMEQVLKTTKSIKVSGFKLTAFKLSGSTATVGTTQTYDFLVLDPQKKPHKLSGSSTSVDTWTKVGGTWKLKLSKTVKETTLIDGKSVPG